MRTEEFYNFMIKREQVRRDKAAGLPWPWTDDAILRDFKFTNVKRSHDTTSQKFIEIYAANKHAPAEQVLLNCAIARYFGRWEFLHALGWQEEFRPNHIIDQVQARTAAKLPVWTGAYVITNGGIRDDKEQVVVRRYLTSLMSCATLLAEIAEGQAAWQPVAERMASLEGFGGTGFMTKEVLLDCMLASGPGYGFFPNGVTDRNNWTPCGPGAKRGINRVLKLHHACPLDKDRALATMRQLYEQRAHHWPVDFVELELSDIQFQLCEFDKYERVRLGQGRPRSKYKPTTKG